MKEAGSTKKRQKLNDKSGSAAYNDDAQPQPQQQRVQPPRSIKRENYDEDADPMLVSPTKKLSFSESYRAASPGPQSSSNSAPLDWTEQELVSFEEGLVLFGRPQWKYIAQHIQTRNAVQVKAYAKIYFQEHGKDYVPPITEERLQYLVEQFHKNKPQKQKPGRKPKKPASSAPGIASPHASQNGSGAAASPKPSTPSGTPKRGKTVAADGTIVSRRVGNSGEVIVLNAEEEDEEEIVDIDIDSEHASIDDDLLDGPDVDDEDEDINLLINADDDEDEDELQAEYAAAQAHISDDELENGAAGSSEDSSSSDGVYFAVNTDSAHPRAVIVTTKRGGVNVSPLSSSSSCSSQMTSPKLKLKINDPSIASPTPVHHYTPAAIPDIAVIEDPVAISTAAAAANSFFSQEWLEEIFVPPKAPLDLPEDEVREIEIRANQEFFEGNTVKTPERYLRIRNHIIRAWHPNHDRYVTKTSIRRGLRDCGDVNAIGRVHQFLELIGAINFNLEAPASCRKQGQETPAGAVAEALARMAHGKRIGLGPAHLSKKKVKISPAFDMFDARLNISAPDLFVDSGAAMVIDVHAHLSRDNSAGVLLGLFNADKNQLRVLHAVPEILSNHIQSDTASFVTDSPPGSPDAALVMTASQWLESVRAYAARLHLEVVGMYQTRPDATARVSMDNYLHFKVRSVQLFPWHFSFSFCCAVV